MPQLTWLGHGCWIIKTEKQTALLDPFLDDSPTAPCKAAEIYNIDVILVSHGHFDHVADLISIAKRTKAVVVANFEICEWASKQGVERTEPMNLGGGINLPLGRVTLTPAVHSSVLPDGTYGGSAGGFVIEADGKTIYFACDTALSADMQLLSSRKIDLAVLPIGDRYTMGPDDSLEAIRMIIPSRVAPAHYNTWPPIAQDAAVWAARVRAETSAEPVVVEPGGVIEV
ncbi:MAG: metal-dependent hydrolase [Planctomycetes bacterium]|nr:metal-dependent hydrolase [Planctomycetota bacterium]